jgi:hypothetical protein
VKQEEAAVGKAIKAAFRQVGERVQPPPPPPPRAVVVVVNELGHASVFVCGWGGGGG